MTPSLQGQGQGKEKDGIDLYSSYLQFVNLIMLKKYKAHCVAVNFQHRSRYPILSISVLPGRLNIQILPPTR